MSSCRFSGRFVKMNRLVLSLFMISKTMDFGKELGKDRRTGLFLDTEGYRGKVKEWLL